MKITLTGTDFSTNEGVYYSPAFKQGKGDESIAVYAVLEANGTVTLQGSMDSNTWADLSDSTFNSEPSAMQIYAGGHPELFYRLKISQLPTTVSILV